MMRTVEIFSAGCPCCDEAIQAVKAVACSNCGVQVLDMKDPAVAAKAKQYGIKRVPAVVIDGKLADCCAAGGIDLDVLRSMGLGQA
jgi:glutaredoxin 3